VGVPAVGDKLGTSPAGFLVASDDNDGLTEGSEVGLAVVRAEVDGGIAGLLMLGKDVGEPSVGNKVGGITVGNPLGSCEIVGDEVGNVAEGVGCEVGLSSVG
jgi:hypothetical protein